MKYNVGDKVRIKSLDWYNTNKDKDGIVELSTHVFVPGMSQFCGKVVTIENVFEDYYENVDYYVYWMDEIDYDWTDEMIECKVEEECPQDFIEKYCISCGTQRCDRTKEYLNGCPYYNAYMCIKQNNDMEEEMSLNKAGQITDFEYEGLEYTLPDGYIFKDENGNVINATKIVLEKKKKEYPKTYEECCKVLGVNSDNFLSIRNLYRDDGDEELTDYETDLLGKFDSLWELRICRDAYWKLYGDEMGLGKPWENGRCEVVYSICRDYDNIVKQDDYWGGAHIFEFPIREMRDAFFDNFKEEIEKCKELL